MIERVSIQNFRCFPSLQVSGLRRINVIVGRNSSGKTAFLESLFLSSGAAAPNVVFQFRALRHLGNQIQIAGDAASYQSLWDDLFHWFNQDNTISIEISGTQGDSRSLRAFYSAASSQLLPLGKQPIGASVPPQIVFEWRRGSNEPITVRPVITGTGLIIEGASLDHFPLILFSPNSPDSPEEHAKRFSELSKKNESGQVTEGLKSEFPFLTSLEIEYYSGIPAVHASISGYERKIPVALLSDGINKLMGILLGIATYKNGLILIDQIEDGFYYDRLESIWRLIYRFATDNNVQLFVTTHSQDCLRALLPTLRGHTDDFCLLRAQREDGHSTVTQVPGKFFEAALESGAELR